MSDGIKVVVEHVESTKTYLAEDTWFTKRTKSYWGFVFLGLGITFGSTDSVVYGWSSSSHTVMSSFNQSFVAMLFMVFGAELLSRAFFRKGEK